MQHHPSWFFNLWFCLAFLILIRYIYINIAADSLGSVTPVILSSGIWDKNHCFLLELPLSVHLLKGIHTVLIFDTQIQFAGGSAANCLRSADLWGEREYKIKDFKLAVYTKCLRTYLPDFKLPRKRDVGWGHMRNDANGIHAVDIFPCINLLSCWWLDN